VELSEAGGQPVELPEAGGHPEQEKAEDKDEEEQSGYRIHGGGECRHGAADDVTSAVCDVTRSADNGSSTGRTP
jgi:hypothetical protein